MRKLRLILNKETIRPNLSMSAPFPASERNACSYNNMGGNPCDRTRAKCPLE